MAKGSDFEREICKKLSLWWTSGERDDVYWRSSNSGGRATIRAQKGQGTFGQAGDIAATDPLGLPLLQVFTIELKRGYNQTTPHTCVDALKTAAEQEWASWVRQAERSRLQAGSEYWLLINKRDRREVMATIPKIFIKGKPPIPAPFSISVISVSGEEVTILHAPLDNMLMLIKDELTWRSRFGND